MRQVKYFVANSLDNYIARPDGSVEWLFNDGTDYGMAEFFRSIDAVLMDERHSNSPQDRLQIGKAKRRTRSEALADGE
jgi:hypothetical protein